MISTPATPLCCQLARTPTGWTLSASVAGQSIHEAALLGELPDQTWDQQMGALIDVLTSHRERGHSVQVVVTSTGEAVPLYVGAMLADLFDNVEIRDEVSVTVEDDQAATAATSQGVAAPTALTPGVGPQPAGRSATRPPPGPRRPPDLAEMSLEKLLREAERRASWGREQEVPVIAALRARRDYSAAIEPALARAVATGKGLHKLVEDYKVALRRKDEKRARLIRDSAIKEFGQRVDSRFAKEDEFVAKKRENKRELAVRTQQGLPASSVRPSSHSHRVDALASCARWEMLVDETGFQADSRRSGAVGVLVPAAVTLLPIPTGFHAATAGSVQVDQLMQQLLDAPVGVIGVEMPRVDATGDGWLSTVLELVQWTVRLIPITGPTLLQVSIEQRGEHVADSNWGVAFNELRRQLARRDPARYGQLMLTVQLQKKDANPLGGYADVVAHAWGSGAEDGRARLAQSGLTKACLMSGDVETLREAWDAADQGGPSSEQWRGLMNRPDAKDPESITGRLLARIAARCLKEPETWERFLGAVILHQQSKRVDLPALAREVEWLRGARGTDWTMPPPLELAWLTAQLERANHQGDVSATLEARLETLSVSLCDEVPHLVCLADLNRSVLSTNALDFTRARERLSRWQSAKPREPGLQYWGRLESQRGQLHAFNQENARAAECFERALAAFDRLSDPVERTKERSQTATYLAIATLDLPGASTELVRGRIEAVTSLEIDAIAELAADNSPANKYRHHLLVRYLVTHGREDERNAYVAQRLEWEHDEGHPWPLILAYRAMLVWPLDEKLGGMLFNQAVKGTTNQGFAVRFMGEAIRLEASAWVGGARRMTELDQRLRFNFR